MSVYNTDSKHSQYPIRLALDGSTAITANTVLDIDPTNKVVIAATSASTTITARYIAVESVVSGATSVLGAPIDYTQRYQMDCTSNTATSDLFTKVLLTDAGTLNNTAHSNSTAKEGIFLIEETVGAAADKKVSGRFILPGQVTA